MEPGIKQSIGQGFQAANRSWLGIVFFAGAWLLVALVAFLGLAVTNPPPAVFEERPPLVQPAPPPAATTPPAPPAAESPATPTDATLFDQLEAPESAETAADVQPVAADVAPQVPDAAAPAEPAVDASQAQAQQAITAWFGRAWPMLLIVVLLLVASSLWLSGGQVGYLAKQVVAGQAKVSEFWVTGTRAFVPLLALSALLMLAGAGLLGIFLVIAAVFAALQAVPEALRAILAVLVFIAALVGLIWLAVRFAFLVIAIVVDRAGPVASFTASLRVTRGRWWRVFWLGALMGLLSYAVWLTVALVEWLGGLAGGPIAVALSVVSNLAGMVASLYVSFAALAAYLRFYEDAKTAPPRSA